MTYKQTYIDIQRDRQKTDMLTETNEDIQKDKQTQRNTLKEKKRYRDGQRDVHTDKGTDVQEGRYADRQIDKHRHTWHSEIMNECLMYRFVLRCST